LVPFLLVWVLGGLLTLFGALSLAELGSIYPGSGGLCTYLRHAYGPLPAFLCAWAPSGDGSFWQYRCAWSCFWAVFRAGVSRLADGRTFRLKPGEVFTIPAGVIHHTRSHARAVNLCFEDRNAYTDVVFKDSKSQEVVSTDSPYMTVAERGELTRRFGRLSAPVLARLVSYGITVLNLQKQLGLKLEPRTGPVDVPVIDHVERPL
jgi:hypothetical protein